MITLLAEKSSGFAAVVLVGMAVLLGACATAQAQQPWLNGQIRDSWTSVYNGLGSNEIDGGRVVITPRPAIMADETHAGLIVTVRSYRDVDLRTRVRTTHQLRAVYPNPWEVGRVVWNYTDDTHFYYVALKPDGWEIGKQDPAYPGAQRYLASGPGSYPLGSWHDVRVQQRGDRIAVWADGAEVNTFTDTESPYLSGRVGLYSEDARVEFENIRIDPLPTAATR